MSWATSGGGTASIKQCGAWKELVTFTLPTDLGLMPGLAAGMSTVAVYAIDIK